MKVLKVKRLKKAPFLLVEAQDIETGKVITNANGKLSPHEDLDEAWEVFKHYSIMTDMEDYMKAFGLNPHEIDSENELYKRLIPKINVSTLSYQDATGGEKIHFSYAKGNSEGWSTSQNINGKWPVSEGSHHFNAEALQNAWDVLAAEAEDFLNLKKHAPVPTQLGIDIPSDDEEKGEE